MLGEDAGETGVNDDLLRARTVGIGATIMGRNMFSPIRGPWADESWRGWWGEDPPFGHDVFVLTHHQRADLKMRNGTTFHFVAATPREVLDMAMQAAGGRDVVLGGGAATIRQFLGAGLVDEMHVAIVPALLGAGERLFDDLAEIAGYSCSALTCADGVAHAHITRSETGQTR
jgi:dihydrofolate reductase